MGFKNSRPFLLNGIIAAMQSQIIGIRFQPIGKTYHFDASEVPDLKISEHVIVDTARGDHLGELFPSRDDDRVCLRVPKDVANIRVGRVGRHQNVEQAATQAGQIDECQLDTILRQQGDRLRVGTIVERQ